MTTADSAVEQADTSTTGSPIDVPKMTGVALVTATAMNAYSAIVVGEPDRLAERSDLSDVLAYRVKSGMFSDNVAQNPTTAGDAAGKNAGPELPGLGPAVVRTPTRRSNIAPKPCVMPCTFTAAQPSSDHPQHDQQRGLDVEQQARIDSIPAKMTAMLMTQKAA